MVCSRIFILIAVFGSSFQQLTTIVTAYGVNSSNLFNANVYTPVVSPISFSGTQPTSYFAAGTVDPTLSTASVRVFNLRGEIKGTLTLSREVTLNQFLSINPQNHLIILTDTETSYYKVQFDINRNEFAFSTTPTYNETTMFPIVGLSPSANNYLYVGNGTKLWKLDPASSYTPTQSPVVYSQSITYGVMSQYFNQNSLIIMLFINGFPIFDMATLNMLSNITIDDYSYSYCLDNLNDTQLLYTSAGSTSFIIGQIVNSKKVAYAGNISLDAFPLSIQGCSSKVYNLGTFQLAAALGIGSATSPLIIVDKLNFILLPLLSPKIFSSVSSLNALAFLATSASPPMFYLGEIKVDTRSFILYNVTLDCLFKSADTKVCLDCFDTTYVYPYSIPGNRCYQVKDLPQGFGADDSTGAASPCQSSFCTNCQQNYQICTQCNSSAGYELSLNGVCKVSIRPQETWRNLYQNVRYSTRNQTLSLYFSEVVNVNLGPGEFVNISVWDDFTGIAYSWTEVHAYLATNNSKIIQISFYPRTELLSAKASIDYTKSGNITSAADNFLYVYYPILVNGIDLQEQGQFTFPNFAWSVLYALNIVRPVMNIVFSFYGFNSAFFVDYFISIIKIMHQFAGPRVAFVERVLDGSQNLKIWPWGNPFNGLSIYQQLSDSIPCWLPEPFNNNYVECSLLGSSGSDLLMLGAILIICTAITLGLRAYIKWRYNAETEQGVEEDLESKSHMGISGLYNPMVNRYNLKIPENIVWHQELVLKIYLNLGIEFFINKFTHVQIDLLFYAFINITGYVARSEFIYGMATSYLLIAAYFGLVAITAWYGFEIWKIVKATQEEIKKEAEKEKEAESKKLVLNLEPVAEDEPEPVKEAEAVIEQGLMGEEESHVDLNDKFNHFERIINIRKLQAANRLFCIYNESSVPVRFLSLFINQLYFIRSFLFALFITILVSFPVAQLVVLTIIQVIYLVAFIFFNIKLKRSERISIYMIEIMMLLFLIFKGVSMIVDDYNRQNFIGIILSVIIYIMIIEALFLVIFSIFRIVRTHINCIAYYWRKLIKSCTGLFSKKKEEVKSEKNNRLELIEYNNKIEKPENGIEAQKKEGGQPIKAPPDSSIPDEKSPDPATPKKKLQEQDIPDEKSPELATTNKKLRGLEIPDEKPPESAIPNKKLHESSSILNKRLHESSILNKKSRLHESEIPDEKSPEPVTLNNKLPEPEIPDEQAIPKSNRGKPEIPDESFPPLEAKREISIYEDRLKPQSNPFDEDEEARRKASARAKRARDLIASQQEQVGPDQNREQFNKYGHKALISARNKQGLDEGVRRKIKIPSIVEESLKLSQVDHENLNSLDERAPKSGKRKYF